MHVIKSRTVESSKYVHYIVESYSSVKGARLWLLVSLSLNYIPWVRVIIIAEYIVEPLLFNINSSKNNHLIFNGYCRVSIPWLWPYPFDSLDFIPSVWRYILTHKAAINIPKLYWYRSSIVSSPFHPPNIIIWCYITTALWPILTSGG